MKKRWLRERALARADRRTKTTRLTHAVERLNLRAAAVGPDHEGAVVLEHQEADALGQMLYGVLALAAWPRRDPWHEAPAHWLPLAWAVLWVGAAIFQALPGQNTGTAVAGAISGGADGAPGWLALGSITRALGFE